MFILKIDHLLGIATEVCKAIAELIILTAFGVVIVMVLGTWFGVIRWY